MLFVHQKINKIRYHQKSIV